MRARRRCWVGRCRSVMWRRAGWRRRCTGQLGGGAGIAEAVTAARRALFDGRSAYWHLLRLYADRSDCWAGVVTPLGSRGRVRLRTRAASTLFLDAEGRVKVADRGSFVGRRRELQALLRVLRPDDPAEGPQIALLHGMGGQGKSSLAARLLDRIRATHADHAVWVGKVDQLSVEGLTQRLTLADAGRRSGGQRPARHGTVSRWPTGSGSCWMGRWPTPHACSCSTTSRTAISNQTGWAGIGAPPRRWRCCRRSERRSLGPAAPAGW